MDIIAKMYCESAQKDEFNEKFETVILRAVTSGSEENKSFSLATPNAYASLSISNPTAQGQFKQSKEYYIKFLPTEAEG